MTGGPLRQEKVKREAKHLFSSLPGMHVSLLLRLWLAAFIHQWDSNLEVSGMSHLEGKRLGYSWANLWHNYKSVLQV